ncbi:MAG TPA: hypothetical protein VM782_04700 [Stellaceae bacterium]|nr:hypothetical protein [Stellaceae bacterium]
MNYGRPELGERLAADYVLGMMPPRARQRFERAMAHNATLAATVAAWSDRFSPLDAVTDDVPPPARIWHAIDRRVGPVEREPVRKPARSSFWSGLFAAALATCAAIAIYVAVSPAPLSDTVAALADNIGLTGLVEAAKRTPADVGLSTMSLGVSERERPRWLRAALLLTSDASLLTTEPRQ